MAIFIGTFLSETRPVCMIDAARRLEAAIKGLEDTT